jgi:hypothetical protein
LLANTPTSYSTILTPLGDTLLVPTFLKPATEVALSSEEMKHLLDVDHAASGVSSLFQSWCSGGL